MLGFLAGLPGKLKTLTDRLSATWASKLDTLHDSRLTAARAGYLDKLNISGNVANGTDYTATRAGYLDLLNTGAAGTVKSIQTGYINTLPSTTGSSGSEDWRYNDITLGTAVADAAKCLVIILGHVAITGGFVQPTGRMTSTTNLRIESNITPTGSISVRWYVIEVK